MSSVDDYLWKKRKIEPVARFDCYTHSTGWFEPPIPSPWITVVHNPHQASQYKLQHAVTINRSSLQVVLVSILSLATIVSGTLPTFTGLCAHVFRIT